MRNLMGLSFSQRSASFTTGGVTFAGAGVSAALIPGCDVSGAVVPTASSGSKRAVFSDAVFGAWSGVWSRSVVFTRAGLRGLVCVAGRAEERGEDCAGGGLLVLAAAGVASGVAFLPKLFPTGLGGLARAALGALAAGFFTTVGERLGRAASSDTGFSVSFGGVAGGKTFLGVMVGFQGSGRAFELLLQAARRANPAAGNARLLRGLIALA